MFTVPTIYIQNLTFSFKIHQITTLSSKTVGKSGAGNLHNIQNPPLGISTVLILLSGKRGKSRIFNSNGISFHTNQRGLLFEILFLFNHHSLKYVWSSFFPRIYNYIHIEHAYSTFLCAPQPPRCLSSYILQYVVSLTTEYMRVDRKLGNLYKK